MKTTLLLSAALCGLASFGWSQSYPGNLAVLRVGDGTSALSNTGNALFLEQYTPGGVLVNIVSIPTNGPGALITSGKATSEGFINRSADTRLITISGYNTNLSYSGSLPSSDSKSVPRGIATIDYLGNYNFITNTMVFFTSNNVRSATTDGDNNFWEAGAASGTVYLGLTSVTSVVQSVNTEVVSIFNGNLYFSSQKTPIIGIYGFSGAPKTTATATNLFPVTGPSSPSPYAFAISPDGQTVYVADDNSLAKQGGIQKYTNSAGSWSLLYTLGAGPGLSTGARGVAVDFSATPPIVYATTAETVSNNLIRIADGGAGSVAAILATAGTNKIFRGLQFVAQGQSPQITTEPQDQSASAGDSVSFSVAANGVAPLSYQWQFNSNSIALATNAMLTLNNVSTNNVGIYDVVITNAWGAVTSVTAVLTFSQGPPPPRILTQPQSQTTNAGDTVVFSVTTTDDVISYQWQKNGTNLPNGQNVAGTTTSLLTVSDVFAADAGSYQVIVANSSLSATSLVATLTVNDPFITVQPQGQTYLPGDTATLSVQAIGTAPLGYQWEMNGRAIPNATSSTLVLSNLQGGASGSYAVLVTNSAGTALSANAAIMVALPQTTFFRSNLVALRVGDGAETLIHSGNTLFLDQFTTSGAYVSTMKIPDSGSNALLISGVASSEGFMSLSASSNLLILAGYNTNIGGISGSLSSSASTAVPRAIGQVSGAGNYTLAASTTAQYSLNSFRSATSDGDNNFWGVGGADGLYYFGLTAVPAIIENSITNCRVVNIVDGSYVAFSTQSATPGIYIINNALSLTSSPPALVIGTGASSSPEDFAFAAGDTLAYIADDSPGGGIQHWALAGGQWTLLYTIGSGAASIGVRSLAADFSRAAPVLYAVTAEAVGNRLIVATDTGPGAVASTFATAPTNELFRAIRFSPSLEPLPATLSASSAAGGQFSFVVSGTPGYAYTIETSTNLANWISIGANIAPFTWTNNGPLNTQAQFYRAVAGP